MYVESQSERIKTKTITELSDGGTVWKKTNRRMNIEGREKKLTHPRDRLIYFSSQSNNIHTCKHSYSDILEVGCWPKTNNNITKINRQKKINSTDIKRTTATPQIENERQRGKKCVCVFVFIYGMTKAQRHQTRDERSKEEKFLRADDSNSLV